MICEETFFECLELRTAPSDYYKNSRTPTSLSRSEEDEKKLDNTFASSTRSSAPAVLQHHSTMYALNMLGGAPEPPMIVGQPFAPTLSQRLASGVMQVFAVPPLPLPRNHLQVLCGSVWYAPSVWKAPKNMSSAQPRFLFLSFHHLPIADVCACTLACFN